MMSDSGQNCVVCPDGVADVHRLVDSVDYFRCRTCGSLFADPAFIARIETGEIRNYSSTYWMEELKAARERSYGVALLRVAETIRMCSLPIARFIDIGTGAGSLLDALSELLPEMSDRFHGIELYPPDAAHRSRHPNYHLGTLKDLPGTFDAGVCIEVIEHLSPGMLRGLVSELAQVSRAGSLFLFNSAQPSFVDTHDQRYLDPLGRGHIVSYSIAGLRHIFEPAGFNVVALPGRDWAFVAEFAAPTGQPSTEDLLRRLWSPCAENMAMLERARFGPLMIAMGLDAARVHLEHETSNERTKWALALDAELQGRCG